MADDRDKEESGERDSPFADVASFSTMPPPNDVHNASTALGPVPQALLEQLKQIAAAAPVRPDSAEQPASSRPSVKRRSQQPTPAAWLPPTEGELEGGDGVQADGGTVRIPSEAPQESTPPQASAPPVIPVTTSEHEEASSRVEAESVKSEETSKPSKAGEVESALSEKTREKTKAKAAPNANANASTKPGSTGRVLVLLLVLAALAFAASRLVLPGLVHR